ncbi:hypothetical protein FGO68_gene11061 [Halteria grandinella]|uniref:Cytochrome c domain-containing protein n=1 Tax=Halteria grandinella TaxID=5974 RepID=A0A8J8SV06_HALGN|nr:hypothetical protein FGO68_gene11061 [Halteria grandinella]
MGAYELSYPANFGNRINTSAGNPLSKQGVFLGRMLFYEPKLSSNNRVSCASCHQQKLAFTDGQTFSTGVGNKTTSRNSMSLTNLLWVRSFFWDGRSASLEAQGKEPITHPDEMGESLDNVARKLQQSRLYPPIFKKVFGTDSITGDRIVKAIAQFERTLISADSNYDRYLQGNYTPTEEELSGISLFFNNPSPEKGIRGANCGHCHAGPKMFADLFHNNGLDSIPKDTGREMFTGLPNDKGRFRAVSLRNIALTSPYMHDGRFKTLEEVLDHYSEHIRQSATLSPFLQGISNDVGGKTIHLSNSEKHDIITFLKMLTDSNFIKDTRFSNPHKNQRNYKGFPLRVSVFFALSLIFERKPKF